MLWLSMLFSTIGIAASDFLCINLSAIASILGISESLAGVTFLAFGNGSPDVFSTFAAMGSNSGSLAVGELVGAACFITAVVAGSMGLTRPFRVARRSFVRDVIFFIIAASLALVVLADGELHAWECATMVGLYGFYVVVVVSWHWYLTHQRRKFDREDAARAQFHIPRSQELDLQDQPFDDDPVAGEASGLLQGQRSPDFEALERQGLPTWKDDEDDETRNRYLAEIHENMRLTRPASFARRTTASSIRPSLVGALEFQSVLSSLKKAKNIHGDQIDLRQYLDSDSASHSRKVSATSSHQQRVFLDEGQAENSAKGTPVLRLDTSFSKANGDDETVPVAGEPSNSASLPHEPMSASSLDPQSPSLLHPKSPDGRLAVPGSQGVFHSPDYQASPRSNQLSPSGVSPFSNGNIAPIPINLEQEDSDNETIQFPPFVDSSRPVSPRPLSPRPASLNSLTLPAPSMSPNAEYQEEEAHQLRLSRWLLYKSLVPGTMFFALFPTLCDWRTKTIWGKLLSIVAAPSVFFLTITIPVIDPSRTDTANNEANPTIVSSPLPAVVDDDTRQLPPIIRLPDESPPLQPHDIQVLSEGIRRSMENISPVDGPRDAYFPPNRPRFDSELAAVPLEADGSSSSTTSRSWNRQLTIIQSFTSPLFITLAVWLLLDEEHNLRNLIIPIPCSLGISLICVVLLNIFLRGRDDLSQAPGQLRPLLSFIGFLVGICWIAIIADEVVSLLKTLGVILNISDSLLGLTVFAVGNSSSDLVADITVARLGYPVMALSACFGGPMLNILLGIGIGGLYMTLHGSADSSSNLQHVPFKIAISKTLVISGVTLLIILVGLLIVVPLNHWKMDRKIGCGLIVIWTLSTLGNVIVEVAT
jgi:solute carrier family 24 (sodium/potassium/calcium exchanger), member 6